MTYGRLCKLNQELYQALEDNTLELNITQEVYYEKLHIELLERRIEIKKKIESNMLILDTFLFGDKIMRLAHRRTAPGLSRKIVEAWKSNKSTSMQKLADELHVTLCTFSRTITAHLAGKYG